MGTLLRLLLRTLGWRFFERRHLSPVSKTIDLLGRRRLSTAIIGGLAHLTPVVLGLALLFLYRHGQMRHSWKEITLLLSAALWAGLGPSLIWSYERFTLPALNAECRRRVSDPRLRRLLQWEILSTSLSNGPWKVFASAWIVVSIYGFVRSKEFVEGFGIHGPSDPFWWMFAVGVGFVAFYSALGCCRALKSVGLVRVVTEAFETPDVYCGDRVMGLSFVSVFALRTNLMFISGWLMVPLVAAIVAQTTSFWLLDNRFLLIVFYALVILSVFAMSVVTIHRRIVHFKYEIFSTIGPRAAGGLRSLSHRYSQETADEYHTHRTIIADTHFVRNWPLSVDDVAKFSVSTMLFPVIAGLVVYWLQ